MQISSTEFHFFAREDDIAIAMAIANNMIVVNHTFQRVW